jgi:hypothetical protein
MKTTPAATAALLLTAAQARAEECPGVGPCDELVAYLHQETDDVAHYASREPVDKTAERELERQLVSLWHLAPPALTARVTPVCREATRRGDAPAAVAAARAWTKRREPGLVEKGRILLCVMQDPASLREVATWMAEDRYADARAICAAELATWPAVDSQRRAPFAAAVRDRGFRLPSREIDPAVIAAANALGTPGLRELLVPVLVSANTQRARGYDRLHDAVCTDDGTMSDARARACSMLPFDGEYDWWLDDLWKRRAASLGATVVYGGVLTAAFAERDSETGHVIAISAGASLGAVCGMGLASLIKTPAQREAPRGADASTQARILAAAGAVAGGVIGGVFTHSLTASPGTKAVLALTPMYLGAIMTLNFD